MIDKEEALLTDGMIEAGWAAIEKEICFTCFFKKNAKSLVFFKKQRSRPLCRCSVVGYG